MLQPDERDLNDESEIDVTKNQQIKESPSDTENQLLFEPSNVEPFDPAIYGKWFWFSNGDHHLHHSVWKSLQTLIQNKTALLLESSIKEGSHKGVIKCYTGRKIQDILNAGLAIFSITQEDHLLFYKTNQATLETQDKSHIYRRVSKYMLTINGNLYERDELKRWKPMYKGNKAVEDKITTPGVYIPPHRRAENLDQARVWREDERNTLHFKCPGPYRHIEEVREWGLFCNTSDLDENCMTEFDRIWMKAKSLCEEGILNEISAQRKAYVVSNGISGRWIWARIIPKDVSEDMETGLKLLSSTRYPRVMSMRIPCKKEGRDIFDIRYYLTEDGELYTFEENGRWKIFHSDLQK